MIAGKQHIFLPQMIAGMVRGMARRINRLQGPALGIQDIGIVGQGVGHVIRIGLFVRDGAVRGLAYAAMAVRAAAPDMGIRLRLQRRRARGMVAMGMGDDDVADAFAIQRRYQGLEMFVDLRSRVDHRYLALADDEGAGAVDGEIAGIAGDDAAHQRRHLVDHAVFEGEVAHEGDF